MPLVTNHAFTSAKADGGDATVIKPSDWNADHTITGDLIDDLDDFGDLAGQTTSTLVEGTPVTIAATDSDASDQTLSVCIRGDGSPQVRVNSLPWADYATCIVGDTVTPRLTTSGSAATISTATIYVGRKQRDWNVETA